VTANGASVRVILSNGALGDQTWHHVAATFNNGTVKLYNGTVKLYVNGALIGPSAEC
jgi:Concanavalin A-like lectin/glucanases superfamily